MLNGVPLKRSVAERNLQVSKGQLRLETHLLCSAFSSTGKHAEETQDVRGIPQQSLHPRLVILLLIASLQPPVSACRQPTAASPCMADRSSLLSIMQVWDMHAHMQTRTHVRASHRSGSTCSHTHIPHIHLYSYTCTHAYVHT